VRLRKGHEPNDNRTTLAVLWTVIVLLLFAFLMLVTLNYWGIPLSTGTLDYQKFGTWTQAISGTATFLGVMIAVASLLWQYLKSRRDVQQKAIEEQTAVYIWLNSQLLKDDITDAVVGRHWDLEIQNLTRAPIYVWWAEASGELLVDSKRPILPNQNTFNVPRLDNCEPDEIPEPVIYFVSREGKYWKRTATGNLSAVLQIPSDKTSSKERIVRGTHEWP
jgi:hypothetical protein